MNFRIVLSGLFLCSSFISCNDTSNSKETKLSFVDNDYTIEVVDEKPLALSSGSGITGFNHGFLVVGDDTPWMYYMDSTGVITDSLRLSHEDGYVPGMRMPGMLKPDFESITRLNKNIVLVMSSGSSNIARDTAYMVNAEEKLILAHRSMGELFEAMADAADIEDRHFLNIEGSNVANSKLYFFNRGDFSGKNMVFKLDVNDFISYLGGQTDTVPTFKIYNVELPVFSEDEMTFSSAYFVKKHKLFAFTATAEIGGELGSDGMVMDGIIAGTSFGFIAPEDIGTKKKIKVSPITRNGEPIAIKIEGFWPIKQLDERTALFYAVSDPDDGTTVLYTLKIRFKDSI